MKRNLYIAALIVTVAIGIGSIVPAASAQSAAEIEAQIKELLNKVAVLQEQLRKITGASPSVEPMMPEELPRICKILPVRALAIGVRGEEVAGLQEFLSAEGYLDAEATGYFGAATQNALKKYQTETGIVASASVNSGAGVVGPRTRAHFKEWCSNNPHVRFAASPKRGLAPLTVTFKAMVGGFTPYKYAIDFGDGSAAQEVRCPEHPNIPDICGRPAVAEHTYRNDGTYTATLNKITDPCNGNPMCMAPVQTEVVGKVQINVGQIACTKEYNPVCGSKPIVCITTPCNPIQQTYGNRCEMLADGATFLHEGACRNTSVDPANDPRCKSWYDGCNTCSRQSPGSPAMCTLRACSSEMMQKPYCTSYFDSSGNRPPVISSFSGPTTLGVNVSGTWTIEASDPENGSLSYSVDWGEYFTPPPMHSASVAREAFVQATTFTHAYASAGTYTVTIIVRDSAGQEAKSSSTVRALRENLACTLQYDPVCGRPQGCANTCSPGMYCTMMCRMHDPVTYSNSCFLKAADATYLHAGACTGNEGF